MIYYGEITTLCLASGHLSGFGKNKLQITMIHSDLNFLFFWAQGLLESHALSLCFFFFLIRRKPALMTKDRQRSNLIS
ncbi:hypothetical protein NC652_025802 [Populus alba x Populus x berolinensis]|nr:hypothetical protein NC652_025802 [Populus alba x Populus x berolinensis]